MDFTSMCSVWVTTTSALSALHHDTGEHVINLQVETLSKRVLSQNKHVNVLKMTHNECVWMVCQCHTQAFPPDWRPWLSHINNQGDIKSMKWTHRLQTGKVWGISLHVALNRKCTY